MPRLPLLGWDVVLVWVILVVSLAALLVVAAVTRAP